jgi:hypothetical protein
LLLFCEVEFLPPGIKLNVEKEDDEIVEENNTDSSVWVQDSLREMWQQETFTDCIIQVLANSLNWRKVQQKNYVRSEAPV